MGIRGIKYLNLNYMPFIEIRKILAYLWPFLEFVIAALALQAIPKVLESESIYFRIKIAPKKGSFLPTENNEIGHNTRMCGFWFSASHFS